MKDFYHITADLGEYFSHLVTAECHKVGHIKKPNSHLYVSWLVDDEDFLTMDYDKFMCLFVKPSMKELAAEINIFDVALCASLSYPEGDYGSVYQIWDNLPIRYVAEYDSLAKPPSGGQGAMRFTLDCIYDGLYRRV